MIEQNPTWQNMSSSYLFVEIAQKVAEYRSRNPDVELAYLGVGDTTRPLPLHVTQELEKKVVAMGTQEGYQGYGPAFGDEQLRQHIVDQWAPGRKVEEITLNDGAKCDTARIYSLLGPHRRVGIQNPSYPVYADLAKLYGCEPVYLPSLSHHNFFLDLTKIPPIDVLWFCSPNNPTGVAYSRRDLEALVSFCLSQGIVLLYDGAYSAFIQDPEKPRSIYEIPGSERCAIELGSFSKSAGFTGIRLGWTVVPQELVYRSGASVASHWHRIVSTSFNGASVFSQAAGLAMCSTEGRDAMQELVAIYLQQSRALKQALSQCTVYGGEDVPYVWVQIPGKTSWESFTYFLEKFGIVVTPGVGFGSLGEGYVRLSGFARQSCFDRAMGRLNAPFC